jgi:hypothetical protein
MPELFGTSYSRAELMRRVGRLEQVAGVRLVTLGDGLGRDVRLVEFRTGTGFAFDIVVDRSFDIGRCELGGRPLNWQSNAGVVGPWYYEAEGIGWFRAWGGGMVVTVGLDHLGMEGEDTAEHFHQPHLWTSAKFGVHGRVGGLPARLVGYGERWDGDECTLWAEGEVLQSAVFGEHLMLRRRVEAKVGESRFTIHDEVVNVGHTDVPHLLLYHCNVGFPVVDAGSQFLIPSAETTTSYGVPVEGYRTLSDPIPDFTEACFEHELVAESAGTVPAGVINRKIGMGVYQVFRKEQLPHHTIWRMMGEDTYCLAMEPATNRDAGRFDARDRGELITLERGTSRHYDLEIGALDGAAAIDAFEARVRAIPGTDL